MDKLFEIILLEEVFDFLQSLQKKHSEKILYNIRKSQLEIDPELFKKLKNEIWEFRTLYQGFNTDSLPFGPEKQTTKHMRFRHMDL